MKFDFNKKTILYILLSITGLILVMIVEYALYADSLPMQKSYEMEQAKEQERLLKHSIMDEGFLTNSSGENYYWAEYDFVSAENIPVDWDLRWNNSIKRGILLPTGKDSEFILFTLESSDTSTSPNDVKPSDSYNNKAYNFTLLPLSANPGGEGEWFFVKLYNETEEKISFLSSAIIIGYDEENKPVAYGFTKLNTNYTLEAEKNIDVGIPLLAKNGEVSRWSVYGIGK